MNISLSITTPLKIFADSNKHHRNMKSQPVSRKSAIHQRAVRNSLPKKQKREDFSNDLPQSAKKIIMETILKNKNLLTFLALRDYLLLLAKFGILDIIMIENRKPMDVSGLIRDLHANKENNVDEKSEDLKKMVRDYENEQNLIKFEKELSRRAQMDETAKWLIEKKSPKKQKQNIVINKKPRNRKRKHTRIDFNEIYAKRGNVRDVIIAFNNQYSRQ